MKTFFGEYRESHGSINNINHEVTNRESLLCRSWIVTPAIVDRNTFALLSQADLASEVDSFGPSTLNFCYVTFNWFELTGETLGASSLTAEPFGGATLFASTYMRSQFSQADKNFTRQYL